MIDFTGLAGAAITLLNHGRTPFFEGEPPNPQTTGQIMQFRVAKSAQSTDHSLPPPSIPLPACADLRSLVTPAMLKNTRRAFLNVIQGPHGPIMLTLSNQRWMDKITETPRVGSVEIWEIMNLARDLHPIHLHLIQFQLLNRQAFDVKAYKKGFGPPAHSIAGSRPYSFSSRQTDGPYSRGIRMEGHYRPQYRASDPDCDQMGTPNGPTIRAGKPYPRGQPISF